VPLVATQKRSNTTVMLVTSKQRKTDDFLNKPPEARFCNVQVFSATKQRRIVDANEIKINDESNGCIHI
jgi:hypothetical protein